MEEQKPSITSKSVLSVIPNYGTRQIPGEWQNVEHLLVSPMLVNGEMMVRSLARGPDYGKYVLNIFGRQKMKFNENGGVINRVSKKESLSWKEFLNVQEIPTRYNLLYAWSVVNTFRTSRMYLLLNEVIQIFCLNWKEKIINSCLLKYHYQEMKLVISQEIIELTQFLKLSIFSPGAYMERNFIATQNLLNFRELTTLWFSYCSVDISNSISDNLCFSYYLIISELVFVDINFLITKIIGKLINIESINGFAQFKISSS